MIEPSQFPVSWSSVSCRSIDEPMKFVCGKCGRPFAMQSFRLARPVCPECGGYRPSYNPARILLDWVWGLARISAELIGMPLATAYAVSRLLRAVGADKGVSNQLAGIIGILTFATVLCLLLLRSPIDVEELSRLDELPRDKRFRDQRQRFWISLGGGALLLGALFLITDWSVVVRLFGVALCVAWWFSFGRYFARRYAQRRETAYRLWSEQSRQEDAGVRSSPESEA